MSAVSALNSRLAGIGRDGVEAYTELKIVSIGL
jgi:hypothetical protein